MKRANPLWLLPIVCVLLAVFSFVGHGYSSVFMVLLWAVLGIWSLVYIVRRKLYKRPVVFLLHLSFMVMLLGAFTTWLLGEQGTLHLRLNETHTAFKLNTGDLRRLPFSITLNNFEVAYIDSSDAPRDYISQVSISSAISDKANATGTIQMNKPFSGSGYRFYQSNYDQDEQGTHLSVSYDPYGTAITYIGYGLLFLSLFLLLITRVFSIRSKTLSITLLLIFAGIIAATAIPNDFAAASAKHLAAEQLYNTLDAFRIIAYTGIALGLLLLLTPPNSHFLKQKRCLQIIPILLSAYLILMLCLRWYISGYIPLTNGCETMLVMALGISITSIFHDGARKYGVLITGLCLMAATWNKAGLAITPITPVLASPLLSLHVSVIIIAYVILTLLTVNSIFRLCANRKNAPVNTPATAENTSTNTPLLLAEALLITGIFVGAIWANQSWGRYWGWDPKETWALITMLIYALPLHTASLKWFRNPHHYNWYMIIAYLTVLITYFGVNYLLGGMHSYAN